MCLNKAHADDYVFLNLIQKLNKLIQLDAPFTIEGIQLQIKRNESPD